MSPLRVLAVVALLAVPGGLVALGLSWLRRRRRARIAARMTNGWQKRHREDNRG